MSDWLNGLKRLESKVTDNLFVPPSSRWRWFFTTGAHLGDGLLWAVIGLCLAIWGNAFWRATVLITGLAVFLATTWSTLIKYTIRRHRPQELAQFYALKNDRYSFPSGHATRMAAIATVVGQLVPKLAPASCGLALFVAACRVAVGVHYPSDVLTGLVIGSLSAITTLFLI